MKLAFVVQRYGDAIAGGSEAHCRALAHRLAPRHDITVLTSCASDYVSWRNSFPAGEFQENGIRVIRFPVAHQRRLKQFADISDEVLTGSAPPEREIAWFRENGPETPGLLEHLRRGGTDYDLILFWAYRYYPSYFGLPLVADRAVLVPTAEEDPVIDLKILREYFQTPAGYLFLTPEERDLVSQRADGHLPPCAIIGTGLDPIDADTGADSALPGLPERFLLYLGRIDRNKGCQTLFQYFDDYLRDGGSASLVLAGPSTLPLPDHPNVHALGYVSSATRNALLSRASALVVPSPYESLSMVLLEAWNQGVPALVNGQCRVLRGQIRRANGGLYYRSSREFSAGLEYLLTNDAARRTFGLQGLAYVEREYRWPIVLGRIEALLDEARSRRR